MGQISTVLQLLLLIASKKKSRVGQTKAADPMSNHLRLNLAPHVRWALLIALTVASDKRDWSGVGARPDL